MGRTIQYSLLPELKRQYEHGGDLLTGKRKCRRPFDRRRPLHLVFRSDEAKGRLAFAAPRNRARVKGLLERFGKKWQVRIFDASFNSNHIHVLIRALDKRAFNGFLRSFSGAVAMAVTGAKKSNRLVKRFWTVRVYSRIVEWGRAFELVRRYILQNTLEATGRVTYLPRKHRYRGGASP